MTLIDLYPLVHCLPLSHLLNIPEGRGIVNGLCLEKNIAFRNALFITTITVPLFATIEVFYISIFLQTSETTSTIQI